MTFFDHAPEQIRPGRRSIDPTFPEIVSGHEEGRGEVILLEEIQ